MSVYIHPMINYLSEKPEHDTQQAYSAADPVLAETTRYLEGKPAMLLVSDDSNNTLLSLVGTTTWSSSQIENSTYRLQQQYYRSAAGGDALTTGRLSTLDDLRIQCPLIPALRFTPMEQFTTDIVGSGTAAKAFLLVDTSATRSTADLSLWEPALWDGNTPFDPATLPDAVKFMQIGLGSIETDQPVRLTSLSIDASQSIVQLADGYIQLYFMNMYHDWTGMREALDARLAAITSVGKTPQEIADKEAALA